jgi:hypothetical protein
MDYPAGALTYGGGEEEHKTTSRVFKNAWKKNSSFIQYSATAIASSPFYFPKFISSV